MGRGRGGGRARFRSPSRPVKSHRLPPGGEGLGRGRASSVGRYSWLPTFFRLGEYPRICDFR